MSAKIIPLIRDWPHCLGCGRDCSNIPTVYGHCANCAQCLVAQAMLRDYMANLPPPSKGRRVLRIVALVVMCAAGLIACAATPAPTPSVDDPEAQAQAEAKRAAIIQREVDDVRRAMEWKEWVCSQPPEQRPALIAETEEKYGWQIAC